MPDAWDNMQSIDRIVNSNDETITTRTGEQLDTLHGINVKASNQRDELQAEFEASQEERDIAFEETRQNLIPLSRQYATLADA
ncbi:SGNH/GDSL hydrolase family protein, partial [Klebsiella variicola]